jgi:hypothetical protein
MRILISLIAGVALCATSQAIAKTAPAKGGFQLDKTTWTFTGKDGTKVKESIDADGNFITNSVAGKHLDHGTAVMKDDKACFTSLMTKDGEVCWTTKPVKVGQSMKTTSDKGEKLTVTRVAYSPLHMPK